MTCGRCARQAGKDRMPRGWKRHRDVVWCDACWKRAHVLRAVTLRVAGPVGATWDELGAELRAAWEDSTAAANLAVSRLVAADVVRTPALAKLPPMPRTYLYPELRAALPGMATGSVVSLLQAVERRYRAARWDVVWLRRAAPPSYRYPAPYPVHNAAWSAELGPDGEAYITTRLRSTDVSDRRWTLRLAGGQALGYQLRRFRRDKKVLAKMVGWFPREAPKEGRAGTLSVRTSPVALLTYQAPGQDLRTSAQHHVPRWIAEHNRRLRGLAHDAKHEKRVPKARMRGIEHERAECVRKFRARIDSLLHQISAEIVGYAVRARVERIELDLSDLGYVVTFPWYRLAERIEWKAAEHDIEVERMDSSAEVVEEPVEALESHA